MHTHLHTNSSPELRWHLVASGRQDKLFRKILPSPLEMNFSLPFLHTCPDVDAQFELIEVFVINAVGMVGCGQHACPFSPTIGCSTSVCIHLLLVLTGYLEGARGLKET
ncbi:unnamed protein product [Victoria cruziana]